MLLICVCVIEDKKLGTTFAKVLEDASGREFADVLLSSPTNYSIGNLCHNK